MASRHAAPRRHVIMGGLATLGLAGCSPAAKPQAEAPASPPTADTSSIAHLVRSYPDHLAGTDGDTLVWKDGTRMATGAGEPARPFAQMLLSATIADQLRQPYPPGPQHAPPAPDQSPGRLRHMPFFLKMYGDCRTGPATLPLRRVTWMPRTHPQPLSVTTVNGVADRLERVIATLETLPDRLKAYLVPSSGGYVCRVVADTRLPSMHALGAAIDIAARQSDYWVWARGRGPRFAIPDEIVGAFEAEKFIWGGKWYQFDTMHFEYRPELFG